MSVAHHAAHRIRRVFRLPCPVHEDTLDHVLWKLGLQTVPIPRHFPVREFRRGRFIGVRVDQPQVWRLWLKAHALGHVLLHRGDQLGDLDPWVVAKQEQVADRFAGWLLIGPVFQRYCHYDDTQLTVWDLADDAGVPAWMAWQWLRMVQSPSP